MARKENGKSMGKNTRVREAGDSIMAVQAHPRTTTTIVTTEKATILRTVGHALSVLTSPW